MITRGTRTRDTRYDVSVPYPNIFRKPPGKGAPPLFSFGLGTDIRRSYMDTFTLISFAQFIHSIWFSFISFIPMPFTHNSSHSFLLSLTCVSFIHSRSHSFLSFTPHLHIVLHTHFFFHSHTIHSFAQHSRIIFHIHLFFHSRIVHSFIVISFIHSQFFFIHLKLFFQSHTPTVFLSLAVIQSIRAWVGWLQGVR